MKNTAMMMVSLPFLFALVASLASLTTSATSSSTSSTSMKKNKPKPNFVVFFVDDLGYGDLGFTGHPTASTPFIDQLAHQGKILTTWYSACSVCTASRSALMTGRQYPRTGLPGVIGPTARNGLPLNETTIASHLRTQAGYATAAVGKWHLGQRPVYLPANHGFDYYLGIPYSDDMGRGRASPCGGDGGDDDDEDDDDERDDNHLEEKKKQTNWMKEEYRALGALDHKHKADSYDADDDDDPAGHYLPLVYQEHNRTKILEQPLDFTHLAEKYSSFATSFIRKHSSSSKNESSQQPFFLYVPFSHVHTTDRAQPDMQYAGCAWQNATRRGPFGDALAETDWIVGNVMQTLRELNLEENTLVLFSSDNGPWLAQGPLSSGTAGLLTGQYAGYYNTGKGSTWEGGIRMPAFAYWKGKIQPYSRSAEVVSSLDLFPTLSKLAGVSLPKDRVYDGRDMSDILLNKNGNGTSKHDFLFFYGFCNIKPQNSITAVRHGKYKAHWCTAPGISPEFYNHSSHYYKFYHDKYPLLFDVEKDPAESTPLSTGDDLPKDPEDAAAMKRIMKAYAFEKATFSFNHPPPEPDGPGEGPGRYGLCCDRSRGCNCENNNKNSNSNNYNRGIFHVGTKDHHDKYHVALGEEEPWPPRTRQQQRLHVE